MPAQEKIRVLIVDDIADTRENLRRLLQFDLAVEVVGAALSGREAIEQTAQLKPDVVIMDINMPDMDGIAATDAIRKKVPFTQVIILSVQNDPSYMRRAMLAGARDYLAKPPSIDELTAAIHRAGMLAIEERSKAVQAFPSSSASSGQSISPFLSSKGRVIVVYSPKGGTGKTTIATNLAISLKTDETRVCLIDGNVQFGDVAVFLNEQAKNSVLDLTPRVDDLDADVVNEVAITHNASNIDFIAAPPRPEMAETVASEQFGKLLDFLRRMYTYVVVDTASYLTDVVQAALEMSDLIVLVSTQDIPAVKNANAFLHLADASGLKRQHILFIINSYDKRITITPERIGESLHQEVVAVIPFDDRVVVQSINRGVPILVDNRVHPVAKSILHLADLIKARLTKLDEEEVLSIGKK